MPTWLPIPDTSLDPTRWIIIIPRYRKNKIIISDDVFHYIITPQLRNMSLPQKVMYAFEVCIYTNIIYASLIYCRQKHFKWLDPSYLVCTVVVVNNPPVRKVCRNYKVVVFQPRTVTLPHLVSVEFCYTFNLALPLELFVCHFLDCLFTHLFYCLPIRSRS